MSKSQPVCRAPEDIVAVLNLLRGASRRPGRYDLTVAEWRTSGVIAGVLAWVLRSDGGQYVEHHLTRVLAAEKEGAA